MTSKFGRLIANMPSSKRIALIEIGRCRRFAIVILPGRIGDRGGEEMEEDTRNRKLPYLRAAVHPLAHLHM